jgi:hypothetical protein
MCLKRTLKSRNILAKCSKQDKKKIFTKFRPEMEIKFARKVLRKILELWQTGDNEGGIERERN